MVTSLSAFHLVKTGPLQGMGQRTISIIRDVEMLVGLPILGMYTYGNCLTPGPTEVRSYAAFVTSFPAEGSRLRFLEIPGLNTS